MEKQRRIDWERLLGLGKGGFATKQIIIGIFLLVVVVAAGGLMVGIYPQLLHSNEDAAHETAAGGESQDSAVPAADTHTAVSPESSSHGRSVTSVSPAETAKHDSREPAAAQQAHDSSLLTAKDESVDSPVGVAFVEATINPLRYELSERFWGWRPNDIFSFVTDNVNNFQLGVIEVTRRTVEKLTDNISRIGTASSFDKNLENARSTCFVIEAESFMFPSSEGKYNDGLEELEQYAEKLKKGEAKFFTRADSLIPLLREFESLLGSCDDNLVKMREEDGSKVSFFMADNYFYYAQGVASAMASILKGVEEDFYQTIERRNCIKELEHAIESCEHVVHIKPAIILDSDLDSIFANHRANMAAHISHARFYVDVLIKTLST